MAKTKKPSLVDTIRFGEDIATLKANRPRQWQKIRNIAKRRGVTIPSLLSGAPEPLQEKSAAGIRREAINTVAASYAPQRAELSRREKANAALAVKQAQDNAAYRMWLDGQVGLLRAQAGAANTALEQTRTRISDELKQAQAGVTAELATRLADAKVNADPTQSNALAAVPAAQQAALERSSAEEEHSAKLQNIGATQLETSNAALIATAAVQAALAQADQSKRAGELSAASTDLGLRQAADTQALRLQLRGENAQIAQGNREYGLAARQLGLKRREVDADLRKAILDYRLETKQFNLDKWVARHQVEADRLKREIEYDKIASREGIAAADRALRDRISQRGSGGGAGGATAAEREQSRQTYSDIQTAKTLLVQKMASGKSERQARLEMIRNLGASDVVVDVALDLIRNDGKLSRAGARKARRAGVLRPLKLWDALPSQNADGISGAGSDAAQG